MDRTDEIRARLDAATPGPWEVDTNEPFSQDIVGIVGPSGYVLLLEEQDESECPVTEADADLIANSPADLAYMLDENAVLRKALELMAKHIVVYGNLDTMLCDNIPQSLHFKYQPKNDGNYGNEPCEKCIQDYYIQQAREAVEHERE